MPGKYSEKSKYKAKALFFKKIIKKLKLQISSLKEQMRYEEASVLQNELNAIKNKLGNL